MPTRSRAEFGLAVLLDLLGAGLALLVATRPWQAARLARPRPLADTAVHLSGRTLDGGPTALALVALAGVVAILATRGWARRGIGVVVAAAGIALVWRSALWFGAVGLSRAVQHANHLQGVDAVAPGSHVTVHVIWPLASVFGGALVVLGGVLVAWRGGTWAGLSGRYSAPGSRVSSDDAEVDRARADLSLWRALDRGEDPTDVDDAQE